MAEDIRILQAVDHDGLFLQKFCHIIEGLKQGRPYAALHARGDDPVSAGEQSSDKRRCNDKKETDIKWFHMHDAPNIAAITIVLMMTPMRISFFSPKMLSR